MVDFLSVVKQKRQFQYPYRRVDLTDPIAGESASLQLSEANLFQDLRLVTLYTTG